MSDSAPNTENQAASIVNGILADIISGAGESVIEAEALAAAPWLALPFVKQIFEFILDKIAALIYEQAADAATKLIIDLQINAEESSASVTFANLQMALASGDATAIKKASEDLDDAYGRLIHYDGSAPA